MKWLIAKYLISAAIVVLVSETAKRSDRFGGFIAALPIVTVLTLVWLHLEHQPEARLANHAWYTFWYVVPTLPMFLAFPWLLHKFGFWGALGACSVLTLVCFAAFGVVAKRFGVALI